MIVANIGRHCLIYTPEHVAVQPALTGVELDILRVVTGGKTLTISGLATDLGCSYAAAWVMVHRLERRGLLALHRNCNGMEIVPLATLLEDMA